MIHYILVLGVETPPEQPLTPVYHATPITKDNDTQETEPVAKKKAKLEYIPMPALIKPIYKASAIKRSASSTYVPVDINNHREPEKIATYIPTKITKIDEPAKEIELVTTTNGKAETNGTVAHPPKTEEESHASKKEDKISTKDREHKSSRSSSSSRSHSSKDKHSKESSSSSSRHKSSSSHKSHKSSSSSSSSRHRSSSSSREKPRHSSSSKRSSSSSSSSKLKEKSSIKEKTPEIHPQTEIPLAELEFQESSDDDEIMAQCRQIFEDYKVVNKPDISQTKEPKEKVEEQVDDSKSKRQAHDNPDNVSRVPIVKKINHVQSAMQSVHLRKDTAIKQLLREKAEQDEVLKKLQAEIKEKDIALTSRVPNPGIFNRPAPKRPMITPITQKMALEAAKRKVDEIRKSRLLCVDTPTIAQTVNKISGRVAHVPTGITDIDHSKLAPPVLEPGASKISCNIRTQYYNIMV